MAYSDHSVRLCGSQECLQRQRLKTMLDGWEANHPGPPSKLFSLRWMCSKASAICWDTELFDFTGLVRSLIADKT